jgi:hypothetical protein
MLSADLLLFLFLELLLDIVEPGHDVLLNDYKLILVALHALVGCLAADPFVNLHGTPHVIVDFVAEGTLHVMFFKDNKK